MSILERLTDERVSSVRCTDETLTVDLMDGRSISVPLAWYPRLSSGTAAQRANWQACAGGYGIHWPDLDEDLSTAFSADATSGDVVFRDGPFRDTAEYVGGLTIVDVADEAAARDWAGKVAVACGWPQEVRPFGPGFETD